MIALSRSARLLVAIAAISFAAIALLSIFPSHDRRTVLLITDVSWIWAAAFAAFCCFSAARPVAAVPQRHTWTWIGAGCASFLAGQLVWTYLELSRGAPPSYPSLADIGFLGIYVCLAMGVMTLVRGQPTRRADPELILDTILVTFTIGALAYEYLLEPFLTGATPASSAGLLRSIGGATRPVAGVWVVLVPMPRRMVVPPPTAALGVPRARALA